MSINVDDAGIKFVRVNATADGDNVVIAGVAGKRIVVLGFGLSVTILGTITVQDTAGTPVILAQFVFSGAATTAISMITYGGGFEAPAFQTAVGEGIEINNPVGLDTLGFMTYIEV